MDWKDTIAKVTSAAPLLGSFFGPPGTAIGGIVKLVASALGVAPSEEAIAAEIQQNPEALLKLRELESTHRIELEKLLLEGERIRLADVQDARRRQTEGEKSSGKRDINLYALAWLLVLAFFLLTGMLLYFSYSGKSVTDQTGVLFMLLGTLSTAFGGVFQYFFGSSAGSTAKSATINTLMDKKTGN
jgi:hypothetical protein